MFPQWSRDFPKAKAVYSQALQNVSVRGDPALRAFFRRVKAREAPGFPRLRGPGQYASVTYPQSGFKVGASSIWLFPSGKQTRSKPNCIAA